MDITSIGHCKSIQTLGEYLTALKDIDNIVIFPTKKVGLISPGMFISINPHNIGENESEYIESAWSEPIESLTNNSGIITIVL